MARWAGSWLGGAGSAGVDPGGPPPGVRLGLPAEGTGSAASTGSRAVAFAIDAVLCGLVARLFFPVRDLDTAPTLTTQLAPLVVFAAVYLVGLTLLGQTPGMWLRSLRVVPVRATPGPLSAVVGFAPAALRTALLMLLVPAVITDADGRGLHDRASGTVVVRV